MTITNVDRERKVIISEVDPFSIMGSLDLSVVVPVKDEAENVIALVAEIYNAIPVELSFEVIFTDDGSGDDTLSLLLGEKSKRTNLRVLHHTNCCGQSAALWSGFQAARGNLILTLDGDGQNPPSEMTKLYKAYQDLGREGLVIGCRKKRQDNLLRLFSSLFANSIRRFLLCDDNPDSGCGLKLFPKTAVRKLPYFDHMHRYFPALFQRENLPVLVVPVTHQERRGGCSKYGVWNRLWVGIYDLFGVSWLLRRRRLPLSEEA
ncbi:glycosyltransferase [Kiloniella majae]|uniref:glycosyltransferase n=1 Tax=Kiloniella majae TaxID=1938558 RepID=UPI001FEDF4E6|nr:glycosyltransferase [Kiloniella majae]